MSVFRVADALDELLDLPSDVVLRFRVRGLVDGLRGREPRRPELEHFEFNKRRHTAAVRAYLSGHARGQEAAS